MPSAEPGLLVVGGGAAGLGAARAFRAHGGEGPVVIVSADADPPYERPAVSKEALRGERSGEDVRLVDDAWYRDHEVELVTGTPVVALDALAREARAGDGRTWTAGHVVLATGSAPTRPPVPGGEDPDVLVLRTLDDARALRERVGDHATVVVVGTGFVGCELAVSLRMLGHEVVLVGAEDAPHEARLGPEVGARVTGWLEEAGVRLVLGDPVARIDDARRVTLEGGDVVPGDVVVAATGRRPLTELARDAGLLLREDRIVVDASMRTGVDGVLAAGDAVMARNAAAGRSLAVEHWGDATTMGEVAGTVAAGGEAVWSSAPGFWSVLGERVLKQVAWGDGHDEVRFADRGDGAFAARYLAGGVIVGVLTHGADDEYASGRTAVEAARPFDAVRPGTGSAGPP